MTARSRTILEEAYTMLGIKGKTVLVTGGGSGIGQAIAVRFAKEDANVAINYRKSADEAEKTHEMVHACTRSFPSRAFWATRSAKAVCRT